MSYLQYRFLIAGWNDEQNTIKEHNKKTKPKKGKKGRKKK